MYLEPTTTPGTNPTTSKFTTPTPAVRSGAIFQIEQKYFCSQNALSYVFVAL
jgi:hypothetical protein